MSEAAALPGDEFVVWNIGQRDDAAVFGGKFGQPTASVDFVEQRMAHGGGSAEMGMG
jgi:hypothetical protein